MLKKNQASLAYRLLHQYSKWMIFIWYDIVEVIGKENIPKNKPCILLPCHQNALMDCVTLLAIFEQPITFFARSDMFATSFLAKIMHFLKIMPAYRQKEGFQNVKKNEDNFHIAESILKNGFPLCIMPEGGQDEKHYLRNFVKGAFRIAFSTQEQLSDEQSVLLLPIGLHHEHYDKVGYSLLINIGQPIAVKDFYPEYKKNPAVALNHIKDFAQETLRSLMLDIPNNKYYDISLIISELIVNNELKKQNKELTLINKINEQQKIVNRLFECDNESFLQKMRCLTNDLKSKCSNITDMIAICQKDFSIKKNLCFVLLTCPIFLFTAIVDFPIWFLFRWIDKKGSIGFVATIKYGVWLLLVPIYHIVIALIVALLFHSWILFVVSFLVMTFLSVFTIKYIRKYRQFYCWLLRKKVQTIINQMKELILNIK